MLEVGNCVTVITNGSPHLFILLTDPCGEPLGAVVVNLTSFKSKQESDTTVVLDSGHSFITRKTTVNYAKAGIVDCNKLEAKIYDSQDQTSFHYRERKCSDDFLQILRKGLRESPHTPIKILKYCEDKF